ncbi:hypothetical protein ACI7BZ_00475 [Xanthobacter sp. AM11]|uniref:hypothetical protein n=1 Tax=Xanthobacter sp. AM11 TaxID=3380643 RepID=UPI0039BF08D4
MTDETGRRSLSAMALRVLAFLVVTMLATTVFVAQQRGSGAFVAELSAADGQEARHFVTGLMAAAWARAGFPPLAAFAADTALHLPAVEPVARLSLLHGLQGAWALLLGPGTPAALLLPAVLAALLAVSAGWAAMRGAGVLAGVAAAFVLSALPMLRQATIVIGPDLPLALFLLLAALASARHARRGAAGDALAFLAAGAAAILTGPAGLCVVLLPPVLVLLAGRFAVLRRWSFWLPLAALAGLAGLRWGFALPAFDAADPRGLWRGLDAAVGTVPLVLGACGFLFAVKAGWRREASGEAMAALAALILVYAFELAAGAASGPLALVPLLAPVVMLAAYGGMGLFGLLTSGWSIVAGLVVALVLLLSAMPGLIEPVRKGVIGMDGAAEAFLARDAGAPAVLFVAADPAGAAALVAAVAQRDGARRAFVVPAGRLPAEDPAALLAALDAMGASAVLLEATLAAAALAPNRVAAQTIAAYPDRFRLLGRFPRADGTGEVRLFAVTARAPAPADPAAALRRLAPPPF